MGNCKTSKWDRKRQRCAWGPTHAQTLCLSFGSVLFSSRRGDWLPHVPCVEQMYPQPPSPPPPPPASSGSARLSDEQLFFPGVGGRQGAARWGQIDIRETDRQTVLAVCPPTETDKEHISSHYGWLSCCLSRCRCPTDHTSGLKNTSRRTPDLPPAPPPWFVITWPPLSCPKTLGRS